MPITFFQPLTGYNANEIHDALADVHSQLSNQISQAQVLITQGFSPTDLSNAGYSQQGVQSAVQNLANSSSGPAPK